ncbi:MAG: DNA repair protein RadA [Bacteroidia bacterium]|nr:DNA repair protein RadA [Bacteroidia bacterium]
MAKLSKKSVFICQNCGTSHIKWQGKCNGCGEWGTLVEELVNPKEVKSGPVLIAGKKSKPLKLTEIEVTHEDRWHIPDLELNRVLGNGLVPGAAILLGGEPGIGKSTLLLQLALQFADKKILYVSGEESAAQIKMRADRIPHDNPKLFIAAEVNLSQIIQSVQEIEPDILIVDSIQTIFSDLLDSAPGSVSQVRECAARLVRLAKETPLPVFLIGHITKEGSIAGPKVLEHMVDTVLTFEGDRHNSYRLVRTAKNRFGSTMEIGIYEMMGNGLREVSNPSEIFLSSGTESFSGISIATTMEGMRPLLIETQALVSSMAYGNPQRSATGFDLRRLNMLLAVLEKRCGFNLSKHDVFINITGGLKVEDPAVDLALVCAIISSLHDLNVPPRTAFAAEVGLSGEIRAVNRLEPRIAEAEKLGFKQIFVSSNQVSGLGKNFKDIAVKGVSKLEEVFRSVFSE